VIGNRLDAETLASLLQARLPAIDLHDLVVEEVDDQDLRLRFPFQQAFVGPGGIFSGPTLLGFADTALYAAAQAVIGADSIALVSTMAISFLKPAQSADVISLSRAITRSRSSLHLEAWLFSHAVVDPILHATASSVIRPA